MRRYVFILVCLFAFLLTTLAYCQVDLQRSTREVDRLQREKIEEKLKRVPEKPEIIQEEVPVKVEEEKFFVKKINLTGCESFPAESFSPIISKYENREVGMSELEALAKEIEREYLKRGVIAAVIVPPQEIKEGIVDLKVIEAKMGQLEVKDHKWFSEARLKHYWKLKEGEVLNYDKISQSVQMMNRNADREVKAALFAGKKPGTTDVALIAKTRFPIHAICEFDNEGIPSSGKYIKGFAVRHNNLLGLDDVFLSGYNFGSNFNEWYGFHSLPINYQGTSVVYGYSHSKSTPKKEVAEYGINSKAQNITISLHQDLYRKGDYLGEVYAGFDANDKVTRAGSFGTVTKDKLRVASVGANFIHRMANSAISIYPEFRQGIDGFGATSRNNPLASRGASPVFSKFTIGTKYRQALPYNLQANLRFEGQLSSTKLTPQEEYSLGGIDSVRGYPWGDYLADNAIFESVELLVPNYLVPENIIIPYTKKSLRDLVTFVAFVDHGYGMRKGAFDFEKDSANLLGAGAGLRINLFDHGILRLEWGFPLAGNHPITESGDSRFHFRIDFQS